MGAHGEIKITLNLNGNVIHIEKEITIQVGNGVTPMDLKDIITARIEAGLKDLQPTELVTIKSK